MQYKRRNVKEKKIYIKRLLKWMRSGKYHRMSRDNTVNHCHLLKHDFSGSPFSIQQQQQKNMNSSKQMRSCLYYDKK